MLSSKAEETLDCVSKFGIKTTMKATENPTYLPVLLFVMPYKVVRTFESMDEILNCDHTNYFSAVLFITLSKVVRTFDRESVDEILKCDHSNESY